MTTTTPPRPIATLQNTPHVELGVGTVETVADWVQRLGSRAMLITDRDLRQAGVTDPVTQRLGSMVWVVFEGVDPNPTVGNVEEALSAGSGGDIDVIVSVGGGSVHDCAKTVALVASNGGHVHDYEGLDRSKYVSLPMVAVNTTAGSGAEMTRFAVITDHDRNRKMILADRHLTPTVAIEDPSLTVTMPPAVTAASGMDSLTHAVEAHVSTAASDFTRALSYRAVELLAAHLPTAYRNPTDLAAREAVMTGSVLASYAFNSASVGAVHAMSHQLGGLFDLVHGECNALLLPIVSAYNAETHPDGYADLAPALGSRARGTTGARHVVATLERTARQVGIKSGLRRLGVSAHDIGELARMAMTDMCLDTNPRRLSEDEVADLYRRAL